MRFARHGAGCVATRTRGRVATYIYGVSRTMIDAALAHARNKEQTCMFQQWFIQDPPAATPTPTLHSMSPELTEQAKKKLHTVV